MSWKTTEHYSLIFLNHYFHFFTTLHFSKDIKDFSLGEGIFRFFTYQDHVIIFFLTHYYPYLFLKPPLFLVVIHQVEVSTVIVATTSICFLVAWGHANSLVWGGFVMHDGFFLISSSFKAYNFTFIQCINGFSDKPRKYQLEYIINMYKPRKYQAKSICKISKIMHCHLQPFLLIS